MKTNIYIGVAILVIGFVIGLLCRPQHFREVTKNVTDTLFVIDTHTIEKPVPIKVTEKETLFVSIHDTLRIKDSVFVPIPIERKTYKGEDYFAEISGYKAVLERIEVYPKTTTIHKTDKEIIRHENKIRLGVEASYCTTLSLPIYFEYEKMLHRNVGLRAGFFYDLPTRMYGLRVGANVQVGW